jgi:hypothetical protein
MWGMVKVAMKWSHVHRQHVPYGLTPSAFPGLGLLLIFAIALGVSWLIRLVASWLGIF